MRVAKYWKSVIGVVITVALLEWWVFTVLPHDVLQPLLTILIILIALLTIVILSSWFSNGDDDNHRI